MTQIKHQRACYTCTSYGYVTSVGHSCNNPDSGYYHKNSFNSWMKGKDCHTKKGQTPVASNNKNDYIEYQQGAVKLKVQNGKMALSMNVNTEFTLNERKKVEKDLTDVFEVVTLAASKFTVDKPTTDNIEV